jgi:hypothetical protein
VLRHSYAFQLYRQLRDIGQSKSSCVLLISPQRSAMRMCWPKKCNSGSSTYGSQMKQPDKKQVGAQISIDLCRQAKARAIIENRIVGEVIDDVLRACLGRNTN